MKKLLFALALCLVAAISFAGTSRAASAVSVRIDISSQSMAVHVNGWPYGRWRVSTARSGYHTPRGSYRPFLLKRMHYSRKFDSSPMPH